MVSSFKLAGVALAVAMLCGCAVTGPGYVRPAIASAAAAADPLVLSDALWYPSTLLGDASSFHATSHPGRLRLEADRLIFEQSDSATGAYLEGFRISIAEVTWITAKQHGLSRIIRLQATGKTHSFLFASGGTLRGEWLTKDEVVTSVLARFTAK